MEKNTQQKAVTASIDISDIGEAIQQLKLASDNTTKKSAIKKILDLPENFNGLIDFKINQEKVLFYWYVPHLNEQAEDLHKKAIFLARKSDLKNAISSWTEASKLNPQDPDYFFNLGVAYFETKKYIECIDALTRTLAICPLYHKAYLILGIAYLKIRKFENSKKHIEKSLKYHKDNLLSYLNLGAVCSILKDYQNGILMFEKVLQISPNEANAYMGLAKIYSTLENTEKANFYFKKVIEKDKKGTLANYAKRLIISHAKEHIDDLAEPNIKDANIEELYAEAYRNFILGNFNKAIQIYKGYLSRKSNDDNVWYALGEAQLRAGKPDLAAESFKSAAKLEPSKGLYYKELSIAFDKLEKYEKVIAAISKANELGKTDSVTFSIWGKALYHLGKSENAIEKLEESLKLNKNNLLAKYYLALSLKQIEEFDDAVSYFDEIINSKIKSPLKEDSKKHKEELI